MSYRPFSPSIFGPYRKVYEDTLRTLNGAQRESLSQVREEETSEFVVNKNTELKSKTDYSAFHKKQNIKFLKDTASKRVDRMSHFQDNIKAKRDQVLMEKRRCNPVPTSSQNGNVPGISQDNVKEARKEQLLRWKREKETTAANIKAKAKPPFKSGTIKTATATTIKGPATDVLNSLDNNKPRFVNSIPKSSGFTFGLQKTENKKEDESARRVTRAMTKAQAVVNPQIRLPVNKMKTLAISNTEKNLVNRVNPVNTQKDVSSVSINGTKTDSSEPFRSDGTPKTGVREHVTVDRTPKFVEVSVPVTIPKKLKPKAIDDFYIEHNAIFSQSCQMLKNFSNEWKNIVQWPDIPENIREDIIVCIGQVKLMLDSKLPQFGQLLYSYLCHEENAGLILPCDLQGWWDVASIQVEEIKAKFESFKKLQKNNWVKEPTVVPKRTLPVKSETTISTATVETKRKQVQASRGIRDFLTKKRQLNSESQTKLSEKKDIFERQTPEKKFEGGFFEVNSPVKPASAVRMATRLSVIRDSPLTSRRSSSTNLSLRMLSVRQSMGSINKIGVIPNDEIHGQNDVNANGENNQ